MVDSLRSLLDGVIDYAGIYPPAKLEMSMALQAYLTHKRGQDGWMVGRFVCPASRLKDLLRLTESFGSPIGIPLTVVAGPTPDLDEWHRVLEHDAQAMNEFLDATDDAEIESYEVSVPSHSIVDRCIRDLREFDDGDVFVELPWGEGMDDSLAAIAESEWLYAKARTGGPAAVDFPTVPGLAGFLHGAIALDIGFKLTAGLHHPLPGLDGSTGAHRHGFLNVLTAAALALKEDLSRSEIEIVLSSTSGRDWRFDHDRMYWCNSALTLDDIEFSRDSFLTIGSCSVDESLNDLDSLGLLSGGE